MGGYGALLIFLALILVIGIACGGKLEPIEYEDSGLEEWMLTEADDNEW